MSFDNQKYLFSFTTGGLLLYECLVVVELLTQTDDWQHVLQAVEADNLFQTRTLATTKKRFTAVRRRLERLTPAQRNLLSRGGHDEQTSMVWLGICKAYRIIREFAVEFVRNRFLTMQLTVDQTDFDNFLDGKAVWHAGIDELADSTRKRLSGAVTQMLKEADIVVDGIVKPCVLTPTIVEALKSDPEPLYQIFPVSDTDFRRLAG